jgi:phosphatidate cytidylyltransferase
VQIACTNIHFHIINSFLFARTKLIKLSSKKTWEGYIGGAFSIILFGFVLSARLCRYGSMICRLEYNGNSRTLTAENCEPLSIFRLQTYSLPLGFTIFMHPSKPCF